MAPRQQLAESCLKLLEIESVTGREERLADHLEQWARRLDKVAPEDICRLDNGLIIGQADDDRPCVALVGHIDTVPPTPDYSGPSREGDRIVGLGASDMKGSVAVMQVLLENLELEQLPFALVLVLYDREEGPYADNGLQPLLDRYEWLADIDLAVAMEPTDNTLQLGCVGVINATATFVGKAAHSARPWQGDNAIHKAGPLLTRLRDRPIREVSIDGLTFREALSATTANGGRARNVIPDRFQLNLNYRFAPGKSAERAIAELHDAVGEAHLDIVDVAPSGPVPRDNPLLEHFRNGANIPVQPKQAWTDVARFAAHGVDAINFGPGFGAQAHQAGEWISLEAMAQAYEILHKLLTTPMARF